jgi:diguanylate cyclase (GGDEF)-like protein/PAS domain S-box-containing protein
MRANTRPADRTDHPAEAQIVRLIGANQRLQSEIAALHPGMEWQPDILFRAMIDTVPDYLFIKDRESRFIVANRAVAADLGFEPEHLIGKTDFDLHPLDLARKFYGDEQRVIASGQPMIDIEEHVIDTAGRRKFLLTTKMPLRNGRDEVVGIVGISRDVTARREAEAEVQFLAHHDALTRLPNRSLLMERLGKAVARAGASRRKVAVAFIDLDGFKDVNDSLGHAAGDDLLRSIATRLLACVRPTDTVARIGGDEFVMLLAGLPAALTVATVIDKARAAIAQPVLLGGVAVQVTCSIGAATFPDDGADAESLLRHADARMYEAKGARRR